MCILCVIQRWSRGVATMLPWLVIPLIGLWALSQLLPPAFRFEITSPRLACVFVLLVTLFWYEVLMPQLSAWRVRRNARLRERKRFEAIELQKLRKTATRRCRNCLTPYKDQNPCGGRFMCSYCGHISKRPILDLPVPPGLGISNAGIIKELVGKGGKILNGKGWSDNGWMCGQDWLENDNWANGSFAGKSGYWHKNGSGFFLGDEHCLAENSYSGVIIFACKLLSSFFLSLRWLWRKIFRLSSQGEEDSSATEHRGMLAKRGENEANYPESRSEKARRKAEEKRQARLEKEQLEEEERKQREEVARLVEERRRLRDEKMEAEKGYSKRSLHGRENDSKKEAEKKLQEGRREKDRGFSKSNSDAEEIERKSGRRDSDKRSENDRREYQKSGTESSQGQGIEMGRGTKNMSTNFSRGSAGTRYLDRMKGTILSSSKAFSGNSFFGKVANVPATVVKENKSNCSVDNHTALHRKDLYPPERLPVKSNISGDDKCINRHVLLEPKQSTAPKKSWQQLFTRSSSVTPSTSANVISRPNAKSQAEAQSPPLAGQSSSVHSFDNPISFGLPSPFTLPNYPNGSSSLGLSPSVQPVFACMGERSQDLPEETELFEDPCYVPDPISLLGPVSESLDNFQLDLGTGFATDMGLERPRALSYMSASTEVNRPSPISRLRVADEKFSSSNRFPNTVKDQDMHGFPAEDGTASDKGTWQMWNSSPLGHDSLRLVGGPASWLSLPERNKSSKGDFVHPSSQKTVTSLFTHEDQVLPDTQFSQNAFLGNAQNGGTFSSITCSSNHDPWLHNAFFPSSENHGSLKPLEETTQNEMVYGTPSSSAVNHPFEAPQANCWSKSEWATPGSESLGKSPVARPHIGGLFPTQDVQSLW